MPGNLLSWVRRVTVNLFLLDRAIPSFLSGVIRRPVRSCRRKQHFQLFNEPPGAVRHVRRTLIKANHGLGCVLIKIFTHIGQGQQILNFSLTDRFYNPPSHNKAREVINDGQQIVSHACDGKDCPVLTPNMDRPKGLIMSCFPGRFTKQPGFNPAQRFEHSVTTRRTYPDTIVTKISAYLPMA